MSLEELNALLDREHPWPAEADYIGDGCQADTARNLAVSARRQRRGAEPGFEKWEIYIAGHGFEPATPGG